MALPAIMSGHIHVSEREVAHRWPDGRWDNAAWEDCFWDVFIEFLRLTGRWSIPATHAEAELLRAASGEDTSSGSNYTDGNKGIARRYGMAPLTPRTDADVLAMRPGQVATIAGSMGVFPSGHRLSRHQPNFDGFHQTLIVKVDTQPRWWWCDPLAPKGYIGEWVTLDELSRYIAAFPGGGHLIGTIKPPATVAPPPAPKPSGQTVTVPRGASFFAYGISGTRSAGYKVERESKTTALGFTASLGTSRIDTKDNPAFPGGTWGGRRRTWAKIINGGSAGTWIDTLEGPNIIIGG